MSWPARRWIGPLALVLALVALATVAVTLRSERAIGEPPSAAQVEPATPVETAAVQVEPMAETVSAVGSLEANESVLIRPELAGLVTRIHFQEGQSVEAGAVLLELDDSEFQAAAAQAAAQERIAHLTYERLIRLRANQTTIVPAQQLDEAKGLLQAAEANRALYQTRLKKTKLRAPFGGTVGLRRVSPGDYVQPGQDLVNLEDLAAVKIDFKVPEAYLSRVAIGQQVILSTDAYPDRTFTGEVYAVDPRVDATNRAVHVRARLPNGDGHLRPGLFATATLLLTGRTDALLIPEEAVVYQRGQTFVHRVVNETARLTEVALGRRERGRVQVLSGLHPGDTVVRAGHQKLKDGMRVAAP
ncbi:efflux RND transporter periplasmic adaptor subunit [Nitrospira moscoviensis]|uniref:Putative Multidrug efflux transporter, membrane fusion protein n=1 Tax=Nitrospira moscoviensis TaxID=42253 RepID=A0A0K2G8N1_NITMO|nr:efflux RND transporter periplasmic adaptor subunit [Nitrospira moscoviensis]ALA57318.1 putative Multidrug efflux transporter, membrane fusion protein [Nitrospira moscoviensis]